MQWIISDTTDTGTKQEIYGPTMMPDHMDWQPSQHLRISALCVTEYNFDSSTEVMTIYNDPPCFCLFQSYTIDKLNEKMTAND